MTPGPVFGRLPCYHNVGWPAAPDTTPRPATHQKRGGHFEFINFGISGCHPRGGVSAKSQFHVAKEHGGANLAASGCINIDEHGAGAVDIGPALGHGA